MMISLIRARELAALLLLFLALVIPNRLQWITPSSLLYLPLELIVFSLLLLVPARAGNVLRSVLAIALALGVLFKLADLVAYEVFARPFNPLFDLHLLADGMRLLTGTIGSIGTLAVALLTGIVFVLIWLLAFAVLGNVRQLLLQSPRRSLQVCGAMLGLWIVLKLAGFARVNTYFHDEFVLHMRAIAGSISDMRSFGTSVDDDVYATVPGDRLFDTLRGKDVYLVFVESYGRAALDDAGLSAVVRPALERADFQLQLNGIGVRSAFLQSPTIGGISWLAHGTALSGLWIDSQQRYNTLVMSQRPTLNKLFQRAGWRTLAAMPAISMVWPEGRYFGYDHVYDAHNSGYAGLPFNWVTMPDQYVLSLLQQRERAVPARAPVMAEIALISSHAPWTPTPELLRWDEVGDGSIFNAQTAAGPAVDAVWADSELLRSQYSNAIEYSLNTLASYAIQYGDDNLVMLILGDHQPAPLVSGGIDNAQVPVHLIARDPAVLEAIADWQWSEGLIPADAAPVWRMDSLRNRFIEAFSSALPHE